MSIRTLVALLVLLTLAACRAQDPEPEAAPAPSGPKAVTFASGDGLMISGDLRAPYSKSAPFVLLCHQARSSRGEYAPIAPRLTQAGYNCLAIDQRSGHAMNDVANLTAARAVEAKKSTDYIDARQDIEAALAWIVKQGYTGPLVLWGSSYSSALALIIAAETEVELAAVLSFAPGEYLGKEGMVGDAAAKLKTATLIVSPESERDQAEAVFERIPKGTGELEIGTGIVHGSKTLYRGADPEAVWTRVMKFLSAHAKSKETAMNGKLETITLGAGCFWCIEAVLERLDGIEKVVSGYMGGHVENPTYEEVCRKTTGHAEVVEVEFDPAKMPLEELLQWFWKLHDPTTKNRQGADEGPQYRSAIFYHSDDQKKVAEKSVKELDASGAYLRPAVTEITKATKFWPAESYHQDYFKRNPKQGYCRLVIAPKVEKLFKK